MYQINEHHLNQIKKVASNFKIEAVTDKDKDLETKIKAADILISNDLSLLTDKNSKNLKWIHLTSAGTNKLPEFLKSSKTLITNSSGVHPIPISEHVFGLMIMLARRMHQALRIQTEDKKWIRSYEYFHPQELFGKSLLIVGMGRIGDRIAEIAKVLGMETSGVVRNLDRKRKTKVKLWAAKNLGSAIKGADFIVNCLPGTDQTKGIFNKNIFSQFKPQSYFINIGRGTTVVEDDLIEVLQKNLIAGAGLDVFETEPLPQSSKLWKLKNVIITPHYSGWTPEYSNRMINIFCENLKPYLEGSKMPNLVNKELGY